MHRRLIFAFGSMFGAFALCGAAAPVAAGDGLPLPVDGANNAGITTPAGDFRYTSIDAGARTVVARTAIGTGEIQRTETLRGDYSVPLVAYDGSASGLSADGERLVLIRPRTSFPRSTTEFAVLQAERLRLRDELTLRGDFSFDALSPDGGLMYLIRYLDPRDPTAYEVRAYDLEQQRLLKEPIIDEDVAPVTMGGIPQTRATSPDGRWAYTLYASTSQRMPFIHALDTKTGAAACINLDRGLVDPRHLSRMELEPSADGATLAVLDRGESVANVDLETHEVSAPEVAAGATPETSGAPWALIGVGAALAIGAGGALLVGRRRSSGVDEADLERLIELEHADGEPAAASSGEALNVLVGNGARERSSDSDPAGSG